MQWFRQFCIFLYYRRAGGAGGAGPPYPRPQEDPRPRLKLLQGARPVSLRPGTYSILPGVASLRGPGSLSFCILEACLVWACLIGPGPSLLGRISLSLPHCGVPREGMPYSGDLSHWNLSYYDLSHSLGLVLFGARLNGVYLFESSVYWHFCLLKLTLLEPGLLGPVISRSSVLWSRFVGGSSIWTLLLSQMLSFGVPFFWLIKVPSGSASVILFKSLLFINNLFISGLIVFLC